MPSYAILLRGHLGRFTRLAPIHQFIWFSIALACNAVTFTALPNMIEEQYLKGEVSWLSSRNDFVNLVTQANYIRVHRVLPSTIGFAA